MAPLDDYFESFQFMDRRSTPDGLGGFVHEHVPGAMFRAGIYANRSNEAQIAGRTGSKTIFTVTTLLNVELEQNDVILRLRDGRRYRITGNALDNTTPDAAHEQFREVNAEVIT